MSSPGSGQLPRFSSLLLFISSPLASRSRTCSQVLALPPLFTIVDIGFFARKNRRTDRRGALPCLSPLGHPPGPGPTSPQRREGAADGAARGRQRRDPLRIRSRSRSLRAALAGPPSLPQAGASRDCTWELVLSCSSRGHARTHPAQLRSGWRHCAALRVWPHPGGAAPLRRLRASARSQQPPGPGLVPRHKIEPSHSQSYCIRVLTCEKRTERDKGGSGSGAWSWSRL